MLALALVKQHCRIDSDEAAEDALLSTYILAATRYVETWTRRRLYEDVDSTGYITDEDGLLLTADITAAMLLLIGHWYANREAVSVGGPVETPLAVDSLLQPYRIYGL